MLEALGFSALAASSLLVGVALAFVRPWKDRPLGLVLAFGAGALISAVSFELALEGVERGGSGWVAFGLGAGAIVFYVAAGRVPEAKGDGAGSTLALGACLDGIPEQLVLGIGVATGGTTGVGLLVAIFVSNLPEGIGSASELEHTGKGRGPIVALWMVVTLVCLLAGVAGYALADVTGGGFEAAVNGFAAGALLVMLIDTMIPDAVRKAGRPAGLATVLGFAVAAGLSLT